MRCPNNQKVQCTVFLLRERGLAQWKSAKRMLGGDVNQITWKQFKENFYVKFFSANLKDAKYQEFLELKQGQMTIEQYDREFDMLSRFAPQLVEIEVARVDRFVRGLRMDLQGFVRAFRPATQAEALHLVVDMSIHERADLPKTLENGSTSGQKRKAEQQPAVVPQRNLRSNGTFQWHRQEIAEADGTLREIPIYRSCKKTHTGHCLVERKVCYRCKRGIQLTFALKDRSSTIKLKH